MKSLVSSHASPAYQPVKAILLGADATQSPAFVAAVKVSVLMLRGACAAVHIKSLTAVG